MLSICGVECCNDCDRMKDCGGCVKTDGHPLGGTCIAAECIKRGGFEEFKKLKKTLIEEFNALEIQGLQVNDLNLLNGFCINREHRLPNRQSIKLFDDACVYWGNQIEIPDSDRFYGVAADDKYLLVCESGRSSTESQIVAYIRR